MKEAGRVTGGQAGSGEHLDRGYAWVVLTAAFVAAIICNGYLFNVGIYYVIFLQHYGQSRAVTSWIAASQGICICMAGPVASILLPRLGPRKTLMLGALINSAAIGSTSLADSIFYVIATFGIAGFGGGLMITSTLGCVALYFDRHLYLATGLVNAGVGVGIMVLGVQIQRTVDTFGWRGAMLLQSGIALQILVCATLIFDVPQKRRLPEVVVGPPGVEVVVPEAEIVSGKGQSLTDVFRDLRFWTLLSGFFLYFALLTILMGILKDLVVSKGLGASYDVIIACFGVTNTLGRALSGVFANRFPPPLVFCAASALCALSVAGMALTSVHWLFLSCVVVFAFNTGQQAVLLSLTLSFIFSKDKMAILFGYGMFLGALSIVGMAPLVGYMIDVSGSFDSALYLSSGGLFICGLSFLVSYLLHRKESYEPKKRQPEVSELERLQQSG